METIEGYIESVIFQNETNGYTVFTLIEKGKEKTCVGFLDQINEGEYIQAEVEVAFHPTYGDQYQVHNYQMTLPTDRHSIERYLSSGIIKGIGPSLARKIVDKFKEETFRMIEEEPERLAEIKGISPKKAQAIATMFDEKREMRQAMIFLQEYGIGTAYAGKIVKKYGASMYQLIKTNPYQLAEDIEGIGFKMADEIAERVGITTASSFRVQAAIGYLLSQAGLEGHIYLPKEQLLNRAQELLGIPETPIEQAFIELQVNKKLVQKEMNGRTLVYPISYYYMELTVARKLYDLNVVYQQDLETFNKKIKEVEKRTAIQLDEIQKEAVWEAYKNGVFVITGGPGTGKTTTINSIIDYFETEGLTLLLAAPTGRAAKRMTETTGVEAQTIHRLLEIAYKSNDDQSKLFFERNEENPLEADVVIVDEMSMVDIAIMHHLLKAIAPGTRLIMVGDVDQLPSVGPGNVLKDIISSQALKVVKLTRIFRQASQSDIVINAHRINRGEQILLKNKSKDFFFIKRLSIEHIMIELQSLIKERLPKFSGYNAFNGLQILTPMRKGALGIEQLNIEIQKMVNPPSKNKQEKIYRQVTLREGDKVMQVKNNYQMLWQVKNHLGYTIEEGTGIYNGDMGVIKSVNHYTEKLQVLFDDGKWVEYEFNQLEELELAYAVTIHKSQGSEYPVVILPLLSGPTLLFNRNLLYTAVTRAKQLVVIVGSEPSVQKMIQNQRETRRYSSLELRISELFTTMEGSQVN